MGKIFDLESCRKSISYEACVSTLNFSAKIMRLAIVGWADMLAECQLVAALDAQVFVDLPKGSIEVPDERLSELKDCTVIVVGDYLSVENVQKIAESVSELLIWTKGSVKYAGMEKQFSTVEDLANHLSISLSEKAIMLFRRITKEKQSHDEAFFRGADDLINASLPLVERCRLMLSDKCDIAECIERGRIIESTFLKSAKSIVTKRNAGKRIHVSHCQHEGVLIVAPLEPVIPYLTAAAQLTGLGFTVRYDLGTNQTILASHSSDPSLIEFMSKEPFNGGGDSNFRSKTFAGILEVSEIVRMLSN